MADDNIHTTHITHLLPAPLLLFCWYCPRRLASLQVTPGPLDSTPPAQLTWTLYLPVALLFVCAAFQAGLMADDSSEGEVFQAL
jgi:hypothetical protein